MGIILFPATAELITEVVIVLVTGRGLLRLDTLSAGLRVFAQSAGRGQASSPAVTDKIAFIEQLDQLVFTVTGDLTGIANGSGGIGVIGVRRWRIACQTSEEALSQWTESIRARIERLR